MLTPVGLFGLSDLVVAVTAHILGYFEPIVVRTLVLFLWLISAIGLDLGLLYHRHELHDQFHKHLVLPLVIFALRFPLHHFSRLISCGVWFCLIHLCHILCSFLNLLQQGVIGCVRNALRPKKGRNLGEVRVWSHPELGLLLRQGTARLVGLRVRLRLLPWVRGEQELIINYGLVLG